MNLTNIQGLQNKINNVVQAVVRHWQGLRTAWYMSVCFIYGALGVLAWTDLRFLVILVFVHLVLAWASRESIRLSIGVLVRAIDSIHRDFGVIDYALTDHASSVKNLQEQITTLEAAIISSGRPQSRLTIN